MALGELRILVDLGELPAQVAALDKLVHSTARRLERKMTSGFDRLNTSFEGISGDVQSLKDAAAGLQTALDEALADQSAKVRNAVEAAVADARAELDSQLDVVATRFEGLDAATPAPNDGPPPPAPAEPPAPEPEPAPVEPTPTPADENADPTTPVEPDQPVA